MATQSKAQVLTDVQNLLKKRYKLGPSALKLSVLEAVVYGICHEGATRDQANRALETFKSGFFDWNEVRVSSIAEIQSVMEKSGIPHAEDRATRLRRFLRQLFEKSYGFTLEFLTKKPLKDSVKLLQEYEALGSDFVLATVIRLGLGGHAIGVDEPTRRALTRLRVTDAAINDATLRGTLEHAVPKNRGAEFVDLIEELAHDTCVAGEPDCPRCELRKICPSSRTRKPEPGVKASPAAKTTPAATPTAARKSSPKSRSATPPTPLKPVPSAKPVPVAAKAPTPKPGPTVKPATAAKPSTAVKAAPVAKPAAPAKPVAKPAPPKAGKDKSGRSKP